jgi:dTDP-4-dehydrorhamnose 3,5-epimerase
MVAVLGMARRSFDGRSLTSSPHMQRLETRLDGLVHLAPAVHGDARGFFVETFRADTARRYGIPTDFVQDNHSRSRRGTLRGIHFQTHPGQGKLVRVARGRVFDVVVDLRRGSATFGEWEGVVLDDEGGAMLWIPVGFGHGFLVLSEVADFVYKCTSYYDPATEAGIRFDDPDVGIEWPSDVELLYSERDAQAPTLAEVANSLPFRV